MASVTYRIKGQYDNKAVKQAESGFKSLGDTVKKINTVISGFAAIKVVQVLKNVSEETTEIFRNQNAALTKFNSAVGKSALNLQKLQKIQTDISRNNFVDGDTINNAMALGVQMGLTEDQIEKVMKASTDLYASGVMPLDQAVKTLSQSYSGNVSALKKLHPELKNFTKEQLEAGEAVDYIAGKYAGMADSMSKTFAGRNTQWKNSIDDLKAAIGTIPASLQFILQGDLLKPLNQITDWIVSNRNYILNFILHLPEVFTTTMNSIGGILNKTFIKLPELLSSFGPLFIQTVRDNFTMMYEIAKAAFKGIEELLDFAIGNPFRKSKDWINGMLNHFIEGINSLYDKIPEWIKKVLDLMGVNTGEAITFRFPTNNSEGNKTWEETAKGIVDSIKKAGTSVNEGTKKLKEDWLKILNATTEFYGDDITALKEKLSSILGQDLPEELQKALNGLTLNVENGTQTNGLVTDTSSTKDSLLSATGEIGAYISAYQKGGLEGVGIKLLTDIIAKMAEVSEIVSKTLNIISTMISRFIQPLVELLEPILNPILVILKSLGDVVASALPMFLPTLTVMQYQLEIMARVVLWLKTFLTTFFDSITYVYVELYNWLARIYNSINGWGQDVNYKENKSWDEITKQAGVLFNTQAFEEAFQSMLEEQTVFSSSSSTSSGASYTAARDVIINISYDHSFVNGDAREIALQLKAEIDSATKLGY